MDNFLKNEITSQYPKIFDIIDEIKQQTQKLKTPVGHYDDNYQRRKLSNLYKNFHKYEKDNQSCDEYNNMIDELEKYLRQLKLLNKDHISISENIENISLINKNLENLIKQITTDITDFKYIHMKQYEDNMKEAMLKRIKDIEHIKNYQYKSINNEKQYLQNELNKFSQYENFVDQLNNIKKQIIVCIDPFIRLNDLSFTINDDGYYVFNL